MRGEKTQGNSPGDGIGAKPSGPHSLMKGGITWDNLGIISPWDNLRRSLRAGAWNVLSLREDDHLSLSSSELKHLDIGIAALSGVRRPDCGEIMVGGYTDCWSGRSDCYNAQGVAAVAVSNKLTPMIIEVTPVNERIMRRRIRHSLCVISLVSVYAPTEASDLTVKDAFYATLESV